MAKPIARRGNPNWKKGGTSPNPKGRAAKKDTAIAKVNFPNREGITITDARRDSWINATTGSGVWGKDKSVGAYFDLEICDSETGMLLYQGDPLAAKAVDMVPREALRQGYRIIIGEEAPHDSFTPPEAAPALPVGSKVLKAPKADAFPPTGQAATPALAPKAPPPPETADMAKGHELSEAVTKKLKDLGADAAIVEAWCYERAGGGGAILIGANDHTTDLREPLDMTKVRSLDWLTPLEARELRPLYWYTNPHEPKFGQVAIYQLIPYVLGQSVDGYYPQIQEIHESRLVVFPGIKTSRRMVGSGTLGWGDNIFTRAFRALRGLNMAYQGAETLLSDFAQAIYKVKGLADLIQQDGDNALKNKMLDVELGRAIAQAVVIDSEEEFERKSTTMQGFPETIEKLKEYVCAAFGYPITLLFGQSPGGMNATGDSDIRFFYDQVVTHQPQRVEPALMRLVDIILCTLGEDPDTTVKSIKFNPLWQPSELEAAQARLAQSQVDTAYITAQVLSPEEVALSRFGGDKYSFDTHVNFDVRSDQEAIVAPVVNAQPEPAPVVIQGPMPKAAGKPQGADKPGFPVD